MHAHTLAQQDDDNCTLWIAVYCAILMHIYISHGSRDLEVQYFNIYSLHIVESYPGNNKRAIKSVSLSLARLVAITCGGL